MIATYPREQTEIVEVQPATHGSDAQQAVPQGRPDDADIPAHLAVWTAVGVAVYFGIIALTMILAAIASAH